MANTNDARGGAGDGVVHTVLMEECMANTELSSGAGNGGVRTMVTEKVVANTDLNGGAGDEGSSDKY